MERLGQLGNRLAFIANKGVNELKLAEQAIVLGTGLGC